MDKQPWPIDTSILSEHDPVSLPTSFYEDTDVVAGAEAILRRSFESIWKKASVTLLDKSVWFKGVSGFGDYPQDMREQQDIDPDLLPIEA